MNEAWLKSFTDDFMKRACMDYLMDVTSTNGIPHIRVDFMLYQWIDWYLFVNSGCCGRGEEMSSLRQGSQMAL